MKCETDVVAEKRIEEIIFVEARFKRFSSYFDAKKLSVFVPANLSLIV